MFYSPVTIRTGDKKSLMGFTVLSGEGPDITSNIHQYRQETRFLFIANKYLLGIWI